MECARPPIHLEIPSPHRVASLALVIVDSTVSPRYSSSMLYNAVTPASILSQSTRLELGPRMR